MKMTEKELISGRECEYPTIKLSVLVRDVLELKALSMYPQNIRRNEWYNRLSALEDKLIALKDVNVELERDWWKE